MPSSTAAASDIDQITSTLESQQISTEGPPSVEGNGAAINTAVPPHTALTVSDALAYLDAIRDRYEKTPETYTEFLNVMSGFKSQTLDTLDVIGRICHLFADSPDLIESFNSFLPPTLNTEIVKDNPDTPTVDIVTRDPNGNHRVAVDLTEDDTRRLAAGLKEQAANPPAPRDTPAQGIDLEFSKRLNCLNDAKEKYDDGTEDSIYKKLLRLLEKSSEIGLLGVHEGVRGLFKDDPEFCEKILAFTPLTPDA